MTEAEWQSSTDPRGMLEFLERERQATERQLRLFALACCSRIWHVLPEEGKHLAQVGERFAEGKATRHERDMAVAAFRAVHGRHLINGPELRAIYSTKAMAFDAFTANVVAHNAATAAMTFRAAIVGTGSYPNAVQRPDPAYAAERGAQAFLLRDIVGSIPFRRVLMDDDWLGWNQGTIRVLAQMIYDKSAFHRLPLLADALEDAGCTNPDLLDHCRSSEPHVRGCWPVDLILAKS
jgi:hypothetical protein